jgi:DNA repair exonuclease SbcCD ATPase subunit
LNVIIGPANHGKTAVVRAIKWALYNQPEGNDFIRAMDQPCRVTVTMSDSNILIREMYEKTNRYTIVQNTGYKVFDEIINDLPVNVIKKYNIPRIWLDFDQKRALNIQEQFEAPFLLSETGYCKASILDNLTGVYYLSLAINDVKKDISRKSASIKTNTLGETLMLLNDAANILKVQTQKKLEMLVTYGIQFVFGAGIEFKIEVKKGKDGPFAEFFVVTNHPNASTKCKPQYTEGGGMVDLISLVLRLTLLQLCCSHVPVPLILDEPVTNLSDDYFMSVIQLIKQLSNMFGRQIILLTHSECASEFADMSYKMDYIRGKSKARCSF